MLIGGTSHVGKSTLAQHLSEVLGWSVVATDSLARHPGRPWKVLPETVPPPVAEHYLLLSADELLADVLRHYRGLWPTISDLIAQSETPIIMEGSALWPEWIAPLTSGGVAIWLTASDNFLRRRIYTLSGFDKADGSQKELTRKFMMRTLSYDRQMMEVVHRLGLPSLNVENRSLEALSERCLALLETR